MSERPQIEQLVCDDIAARQSRGVAKYGTTVRDNPLPLREWLQHQYEELLDAAIYCRRAIEELDRDSVCDECGGTGEIDTGGFTPWGYPISVGCTKCGGSS